MFKEVDYFHGSTVPSVPGPRHYRAFTITLRHTTFGRTPLDEWSSRRRDLYLTTHNTHKRQTSMPPAGFEPAVPASWRPQINALLRAAIGISKEVLVGDKQAEAMIQVRTKLGDGLIGTQRVWEMNIVSSKTGWFVCYLTALRQLSPSDGTTDYLSYILESNPHPFYSFRGLKNQMRIRITVESWILEKW